VSGVAGQNQTISELDNDSSQLPFIGERNFNFSGGSGTSQYIVISSDGNVRLGWCNAMEECGDSYTGPYEGLRDQGYLIKDGKIYSLRKDGSIEKGCRDENEDCASDLN
jgi:hypothetical protein